MKHLRLTLPLAALLASLGAPAPAAEPAPAPASSGRQLLQPPTMSIPSPITDRFAVRVLYARPSIDTDMRYDSSIGLAGTLVDAEETLGLQDKLDLFSLDMMFRMGERHRIKADFSKLTRRGDEVISQQIRFGDDVYVVSDRVVSAMDLRKLGLGYTYSPVRREKFEVGLGLGIHLLQLDGTLEAPARFVRETLDTAGPFATLNAELTWRVTRRFSFNASAQYLDLALDDTQGGFRNWHADLQYRGWRNLAIGAGYSQSRYRIDSTDEDFAGFFQLKYAGPELFLRVSF